MKSKIKKYVTIDEGVDFRTIAKTMTENGYKMNHATARNVLISAIRKLMSYTAEQVGTKMPENVLCNLVKNQEMHFALADVLCQTQYKYLYDKTRNEKVLIINKAQKNNEVNEDVK